MINRNEAESDWSSADALSCDCERELTTIDPLVKGQQLITPEGTGADGIDSKFSSDDEAFDSLRAVFFDERFALQQACASIDIDPAIA